MLLLFLFLFPFLRVFCCCRSMLAINIHKLQYKLFIFVYLFIYLSIFFNHHEHQGNKTLGKERGWHLASTKQSTTAKKTLRACVYVSVDNKQGAELIRGTCICLHFHLIYC